MFKISIKILFCFTVVITEKSVYISMTFYFITAFANVYKNQYLMQYVIIIIHLSAKSWLRLSRNPSPKLTLKN